MTDQFSRTKLLLGKDAMTALANARVAVFGIGGVGGYVVEALARSGIGALDLIDADKISLSNINRQIIATHKTLGQLKVDAARDRVLDINPDIKITTHNVFFLPETEGLFDFSEYNYVVDAIDTVTGKISIIMKANACGTPVISSMGAGNKLDPAAFEVADIYSTSVCPLAKVMRRELKKRGIKSLKVVYSREIPIKPGWHTEAGTPLETNAGTPLETSAGTPLEANAGTPLEDTGMLQDADVGTTSSDGNMCQVAGPVPDIQNKTGDDESALHKRQVPGSCAFVPSAAGLIIASEVIKDLIGYHGTSRQI